MIKLPLRWTSDDYITIINMKKVEKNRWVYLIKLQISFISNGFNSLIQYQNFYVFLYMPGLDINWFRADKGYNPDVIKKSLERRFRDPKLVDQIIEKDNDWRKLRYQLDMLNKQWNQIGEAIKNKKKVDKNDPCVEELEQKKANEQKQQQVTQQQKKLLAVINSMVNSVGNIVHESVPVFNNQEHNKIQRVWGENLPRIKITGKLGGLQHHQILEGIGGYDPKRGQKIAGHRGYFLKGPGVLLNSALINYGLTFLAKRSYTPMQPPFFMKRQIMAETCQLSDFDQSLYKVEGKGSEEVDNDYYLIATSEQPISAYHREQWIEQKSLPLRYAGTSTCFRKQAGAHGKDNWGIFRIHQFQKIEQFVLTKPEDSWAAHQQMIATSEQFMRSLQLPYQVINIVSGALNDAAAKKYDLEAWFPGYNAYRQLVSCSNCTDFQARNLEIRCGTKKSDNKQKKYVHMLNGTLCATQRTLCCILQNYQTEKGLRVPVVLQAIVGTDFLPYTEQFLEEMKKKQQKQVKEQQAKQAKQKKKDKKKDEKKDEKTDQKKQEQQKPVEVKEEAKEDKTQQPKAEQAKAEQKAKE